MPALFVSNKRELAHELGVSLSTLLMHDAGSPGVTKRGYNVEKWRLHLKRRGVETRDMREGRMFGKMDVDAMRAEKLKRENTLLDFDIGEAEGRLVSVETRDEQLLAWARIFSAGVENLRQRVTALASDAALIREVDAACDGALQAMKRSGRQWWTKVGKCVRNHGADGGRKDGPS